MPSTLRDLNPQPLGYEVAALLLCLLCTSANVLFFDSHVLIFLFLPFNAASILPLQSKPKYQHFNFNWLITIDDPTADSHSQRQSASYVPQKGPNVKVLRVQKP